MNKRRLHQEWSHLGDIHSRRRPVIVQTSVHFSEIVHKLRIPLKKICCSESDPSTDRIGTQLLREVMGDSRLCFLFCICTVSFFKFLNFVLFLSRTESMIWKLCCFVSTGWDHIQIFLSVVFCADNFIELFVTYCLFKCNLICDCIYSKMLRAFQILYCSEAPGSKFCKSPW